MCSLHNTTEHDLSVDDLRSVFVPQSLLLAATLVMDAKAGRNLAFRTGEKYIRYIS